MQLQPVSCKILKFGLKLVVCIHVFLLFHFLSWIHDADDHDNDTNKLIAATKSVPVSSILPSHTHDYQHTQRNMSHSSRLTSKKLKSVLFNMRETNFTIPRNIVMEPNISRIDSMMQRGNSRTFIRGKRTCHYCTIIIVCSHHTHHDFRKAIRNTWGKPGSERYRTIFLLGKHNDDYWNQFIQTENIRHGDLLQVDVLEDYKNLSLKILAGLNWINSRIPHIAFVIKSDDDVFLNVPYMQSFLEGNKLSRDNILGAVAFNSKVERDVKDVWSIPFSVYPFERFPPYVTGGSYVMSRSTLVKLLDVAEYLPLIHLEDVFITGIVAKSAAIGQQAHDGFSYWMSRKASVCDFVKNRRMNSVNISLKSIYDLFREIKLLRSSRKC